MSNIDTLLNNYLAAEAEVKRYQEIADKKKALLEAAISTVEPDEDGVRRFEGTRAKVSRGADTVSQRFDTTAFKKANPNLHKQFLKETPVKGRFTVTRTED